MTFRTCPERPSITFGTIVILAFFVFFPLSHQNAEAGGAVARRRQSSQQQMQLRRQQQVQAQAQLRIHQQQMQQARIQRQLTLNPQNARANLSGGELTQDITLTEEIDESQVKDVVAIEDIWKAFELSSRDWALIMETKAKMLTIARFVDQFRQKGITIAKSPLSYARAIDAMVSENPSLLNQPFEKILEVVAIIEYDFDNGVDKDAMALKLLGEKAFLANKERLGQTATQPTDARIIE